LAKSCRGIVKIQNNLGLKKCGPKTECPHIERKEG